MPFWISAYVNVSWHSTIKKKKYTDLGLETVTYTFSSNYQIFNSQLSYIDCCLKLIRETKQWKLFSCFQRCKQLLIPAPTMMLILYLGSKKFQVLHKSLIYYYFQSTVLIWLNNTNPMVLSLELYQFLLWHRQIMTIFTSKSALC